MSDRIKTRPSAKSRAYHYAGMALLGELVIATTQIVMGWPSLPLKSLPVNVKINQPNLKTYDNFYAAEPLTSFKADALRVGLSEVLESSPSKIIFLGETDHTDDRQLGFLADTETLRLLAAKGVKRIFTETDSKAQPRFDAIAAHPNDKNFTLGSGMTVNFLEAYSAARALRMETLIRNAAEAGIKVLAGDANNTWATLAWQYNSRAMAREAYLINYIAPNLAAIWRNAGDAPYMRRKLDDTLVADFVRNKANEDGKSLIVRGALHIQSNLQTGLRSLMPDAMSLTYNYSELWSKAAQQDLCKNGVGENDTGVPLRATDYLIDLDSATIKKCAQPGGVS